MSIPYYADPATFNPARRQTIDRVDRQLSAGFCPTYFISAHFRCPTEVSLNKL